MIYILDFCGTCGALLRQKLVTGCCENCGTNVTEREARIQGEFEEAEAKRLFAANDEGPE